jgi:histidinol dehydrogenase
MKIYQYPDPAQWDALTARPKIDVSDMHPRVAAILAAVRSEGDAALLRFAREFDRAELAELVVSEAEFEAAAAQVEPELAAAIASAARNIEQFHAAQRYAGIEVETMPGVRCLQRSVAIRRIGLYVPGGSAPLFSTVLMLAIPARLAGCAEIVLCTPPDRNGDIAPAILYAARLCGVTRVFKAGGAQAIGAMAYGTQTVPRVDKIFGPGNQWVTVAKQQVSLCDVAIDMPAGPSEVLVLADERTAVAAYAAADLLSQAEHGPDSQVLLVTESPAFARQVESEVVGQLAALPRREIAEKAIANSRIIVLKNRAEMIAFANVYAAEHLVISMENPWDVADQIAAAGSVFIGNHTPESAGDYASGTNHTLPTHGWTRACSGVNLDSFIRKITYQEITKEGLKTLAKTLVTMARAEGLAAHAHAVHIRTGK